MRTFVIEPNSSAVVLQIDSGLFPASQANFKVYNIGRTPVYAETKYGTKVRWEGGVSHADILQGETKVLPNFGKSYFVLGLEIHNRTNVRAIVAAGKEHDFYDMAVATNTGGAFDVNYNDLLRTLIAAGLKLTPKVGSTLSGILEHFWPKNEPNAWKNIKDKVSVLVDSRVIDAINGILNGDIKHYEERINVLQTKLDAGQNSASYYMNIAEDLVGFENKFIFGSSYSDYKQVNFFLLPLYSTLVMMKAKYYIYGLNNSQKIGLSSDNLTDIRRFASRLINGENGANKYINNMYKERVDHAYATVHPLGLYDTMMSVRTYIGVHGLEYIPIWDRLLEKQTSENVYNDAITYSHFYGRISSNLDKEAIPEVLGQPLCPSLVNRKRNKLTSVLVYIWRINSGQGMAKIGGLKLIFENNNTYTMGTVSWEYNTIDFKGANLDKLVVTGNGALDRLTFYFSDGRQITAGTDDSRASHTFEMKGHHIVSLILTSDAATAGGQALNIAVSYQLNGN